MNITNDMGLPEPFVDAAQSDHVYKPNRYSATELLKGVREVILTHRHSDEITKDASDMVWAIFGTAVHKVLEEGEGTESQFKEQKLVVPVGDHELSGIFDLYDADAQMVVDYKTASVWKLKVGDTDDWKRQLVTYAWMLESQGHPCKHGRIVALLKDHSLREARFHADYPQHPVRIVDFDFTKDDLEEAGAFVVDRFEALARAEGLPDDELPLCTPEERWAKPDKWAVKKTGNKKALRVFESEQEANELLAEKGKGFEVEFRPGEDTKCISYCSACEFCSYCKKEGE